MPQLEEPEQPDREDPGPVPDGQALAEMARGYEYDRYIAVLMAPAERRPDLMALAGFLGALEDAIERAGPQHAVFRLQWWRDTLAAYDAAAPVGHPVADAMGRMMRQRGLPDGLVLGLIDGAAAHADDQPFADDVALFSHLAKTEAAAMSLAVRILAGPDAAGLDAAGLDAAGLAAADRVAADAGRAYGLARRLHALPADFARGHLFLPVAATVGAGMTPGSSPAEPGLDLVRDALAAALAGLAAEARAAHARAATGVAGLDRRWRPAFLPLAAVPLLLATAAGTADRWREQRPVPKLSRLWRLVKAHSFGQFH